MPMAPQAVLVWLLSGVAVSRTHLGRRRDLGGLLRLLLAAHGHWLVWGRVERGPPAEVWHHAPRRRRGQMHGRLYALLNH